MSTLNTNGRKLHGLGQAVEMSKNIPACHVIGFLYDPTTDEVTAEYVKEEVFFLNPDNYTFVTKHAKTEQEISDVIEFWLDEQDGEVAFEYDMAEENEKAKDYEKAIRREMECVL